MLLAPSISGLFKWRQFEPEVILLAVGWYLRFSLSYRLPCPSVVILDSQSVKTTERGASAAGVLRYRSKRLLVCHFGRAHKAESFRVQYPAVPSPPLFRLRAWPSHCRSSEPGAGLAFGRPDTNRDRALRLLRPDTIGHGSTSGNDHR